MKKDNQKIVEELFAKGVHLGHSKSRIHPKAKANIYTILNGVSIIDLTKTVIQIDRAREVLKEHLDSGKLVLFVATKEYISRYMAEKCELLGVPYVNYKWHCGTLTNFDSISKNIKKLEMLNKQRESGEWNKFVKHEQVKLEKEIVKLRRLYGGLSRLERLPDLLFIVDTKTEKNALKEAKQMGIKTVAIVDTNSDPNEVDYPIVANDDSLESLQIVLDKLLNGIKEQESK